MERLIYDRTVQDIADKTAKAYYRASDINRVNAYIDYLSDELGLELETVDVEAGDILTKAKMQDIIDCVNELRDVWYVAEDTPPTPTVDGWNYAKANAIEQILQNMYEFMQGVKIDYVYAGAAVAGTHITFRGGRSNV